MIPSAETTTLTGPGDSDVGIGPLRPHGGSPRASLLGAIDAKCRECIYDPKSGTGTWRQQVEACTSQTCPLFQVRPMSEGCHGS